MRSRRTTVMRLLATLVAVGVAFALAPGDATHAQSQTLLAGPRPVYVPPIHHVFVINIENKGYDETWGDASTAPYLAHKLRRKGALLVNYFGTAHNSLPNYVAQISGQAPNPATQGDCLTYSKFVPTGPDQAPQQAVGGGCVYPKRVPTLAKQLTLNHLQWRGYMQQAGKPCVHPRLGAADTTQHATRGHNYAVRHNPFMYFRGITSRQHYCRHHVRVLHDLAVDLRHVRTTPNLSYITPDLCADGHDNPCANGDPGGLVKVNAFLKKWAPRILASPAFRKNGLLVITTDEADSPITDSSACCGELSGPNTAKPGIVGPGGGRVGALVISRWTAPHSWSTTGYNHYSLLASLEEIFGVRKLGMARQPGLDRFGLDVYNTDWWTQ